MVDMHVILIPTVWKLRHEFYESKASLGYRVRPFLKRERLPEGQRSEGTHASDSAASISTVSAPQE